MKHYTRHDEQGLGHIVLIALAAVVIAAIGVVGWRVMESNKEKDGTAKNTTSKDSAQAQKVVNDECVKEIKDKDFCKFASNWSADGMYAATFTTTEPDGKTGSYKIENDGKGNSQTIMSENGKETYAYISLDKVNYMKQDNVWYKMPAQATEGVPSQDTNPAEDINVDFKDEAKTAATYKKIGKEKCGNLTCFKYQIIDPSDTDTLESYVWFDDDEYRLVRWTSKSKGGGTTDSTFTYTSVKITAPSPVKDYAELMQGFTGSTN